MDIHENRRGYRIRKFLLGLATFVRFRGKKAFDDGAKLGACIRTGNTEP
jgi:hypothetical protein